MTITDRLGDEMKQYEAEYRVTLPKQSYAVLRVDGRAFHTYTRGLAKPYDKDFNADMDAVALELCREVSGAKLAYVQSDEISVLFTDLPNPKTEPWFGGVVSKIVSVSASLATAVLNERRPGKRALFDSRVFVLPNRMTVENYFHWRQVDAIRNSVQLLGHNYFSHGLMHGWSSNTIRFQLSDIGHPWEEEDPGFRFGRLVTQKKTTEPITYTHKKTGEVREVIAERSIWVINPATDIEFTDRED